MSSSSPTSPPPRDLPLLAATTAAAAARVEPQPPRVATSDRLSPPRDAPLPPVQPDGQRDTIDVALPLESEDAGPLPEDASAKEFVEFAKKTLLGDSGGDVEEQKTGLHGQTAMAPPGTATTRGGHRPSRYFSAAAWWQDEYWDAMISFLAAAGLVVLLQQLDNKPEPELGWGLQIDTAFIALISVVRVAIKGMVESAISQGAWIWVSERSQKRCKHYARLADFKNFDEASRGLWGSLCLLWRLRLRHLGCVGAAIVVLIHGFETFSQQMIIFDQRPHPVERGEAAEPPPPPRAERWDNYLYQGYFSDPMPTMSTRAAVYNGIISAQTPTLKADCLATNCSWPIIPSLAACGQCGPVPLTKSCEDQKCSWSTPAGTHVNSSSTVVGRQLFTVAPTNGTAHLLNSTERAYLSIFDLIALDQTAYPAVATAQECALWFCMHSYNITVTNGNTTEIMLETWSNTTVEHSASSAAAPRYLFVGAPASMNTVNSTAYSVTQTALQALRSFINPLVTGWGFTAADASYNTSDWVTSMWAATADDPGRWINTLAHSITLEVRQKGTVRSSEEGGDMRYAGTSERLTSVIRVQWWWLAYPGVLLILSLYYLVHTILTSARDEVSVWKGSALPMLFCRIDPNIHRRVGSALDVPTGLDDRVGHLRVALYRGENGEWAFRTTAEDGEDDA